MNKIIRILLISATSFYLVMGFLMLYLNARKDALDKDKEFIMAGDGNICIFAAHQDDGVIMASGYAVQTIKNGGSVSIVYIFDGETGNGRNRNIVRMNESFKAWELAGVKRENISFLDYDQYYGLIDEKEIKSCINDVTDLLRKNNFDIIFIPLYEGGHYQHDITNYVVSRAYAKSGIKCKLYECPEYNAYYSLKYTPEKILSLISRLIPFYEFKSPPSFIRNGNRLYLDMSEEELILKRKMLQAFESQDVEGLLDLYGYRDSYQIYTGYNYSKPPFNYDGSIAKYVNDLKKVPVLRSFLWWLFGKTKPRHPDPDFMFTRIILNE
ncbi:MAG: PIG-L family deacetylase [Candidatus Scalindua sp.]